LGNFKLHYPLYHQAVELDWTFDEEHQLERAHNDHLQILAEVGLVGFVAWVSIFVTAFYVAWNCLRAKQEWIPAQAFFVCLGIVSLLVVAGFSFPMERAIPPVYLFALLGMLGFLHVERTGTHEGRGQLASSLRWAGMLFLVGFLATSVHFAYKAIRTDAYYTKGVQQTNAGEHERAVRLLERARRLSPRDTNVLLALAGNHTSMGRCDLALERLREVLELHPHKVNAISNTGYCHLQQQDYREAERYFLLTLELIPSSPETHTNLGTVHFKQGKHDLAIEAYRKAIDLAETKLFLPSVRTEARFVQPRLLLANVFVAQERLGEAIEQYEEVLDRDPGMQDVRRLLAELYRTIGEPERPDKSPDESD
jgi:Tfp pilus assembly protein PilF